MNQKCESRKIIHLDMDAFFASVEQKLNPHLKGKPVIVCGDPEGRTVVSTCSYEARKYGVKSGMPLGKARKRCPQAILVGGDIEKYLHTLLEIMNILRDYSDLVEVFSIDEVFLDVTETEHLFSSAEKIAKEIKSRIKKELNLTCSIGIGPNKLLAKLASGMNKPDGLTVISSSQVGEILESLPLSELCGIGQNLEAAFNKMGVRTCGELARIPVWKLKKSLGLYGVQLHQMCRGMDESPVEPHWLEREVKSVGHSYTLPCDISYKTEIERVILGLAEKVGRRLRKLGYGGRTVSLVIRESDFTTCSRNKTIDTYINSGYEIFKVCQSILKRIPLQTKKIRLLGVRVSSLRKSGLQPSLVKDKKLEKIDRVSDRINDKFGEFTLLRASLLEDSLKPIGHLKRFSAILPRKNPNI